MSTIPVSSARWQLPVYATTIFVSAFLLFQVQPIISKAILPWFGGSPAVWTTAMLFFQTLLFAGYAYAHFSREVFSPKVARAVHVGLLILAAVAVCWSILPSQTQKPPDSNDPSGRILLLLGMTVALPYFVLSATGPLVQAWFSGSFPGRSPYRLYSLSNAGSLLALLTYPVLIEPTLKLSGQAICWEVGFGVFAILCGLLALRSKSAGDSNAAPPPATPDDGNPYRAPLAATSPTAEPAAVVALLVPEAANGNAVHAADECPSLFRIAAWLLLPAFASLMLLATTNHACQDVAVIPFLWVVPLAIYLLTFIICFDHPRWYWPRSFGVAALVILFCEMFYAVKVGENRGKYDDKLLDVLMSFAALFVLCMLCHGELVRIKPHPRRLTMFYLLIAAGGALGGLFVSLVAPHVFTGYTEWNLGWIGGNVLAAGIILGTVDNGLLRRYPWLIGPALVVVGILLASRLELFKPDNSSLAKERNFYGVLRVYNTFADNENDVPVRELVNGGILHGEQLLDSDRRTEPTSYYAPKSGVGRAISFYSDRRRALSPATEPVEQVRRDGLPPAGFPTTQPAEEGVRVGAIGLGAGTLAAYARLNDIYTFYEINPQVPPITDKFFTFLSDARQRMGKGHGRLEIVMGDARLSLERELKESGTRKFDVLAVDAFSGDAIPVHLLTREAGDIYAAQLARGGTLAIHISNRYLDLEPVVRGLAEHLKLQVLVIHSDIDSSNGISASDWMLLSDNPRLLASLGPTAEKQHDPHPSLLWTDDYSNLFRIFKFKSLWS